MNYVDVWGGALSSLRKTLPSHALSAWFEPVDPIGFSGDKILLEVPNQFFAEWIESHYDKELRDALRSNSDKGTNYRFIISDKEPTPLNASESNTGSTIAPLYKNNINKQYRFENFIEGSNNEFAKNAAISVANNPGKNGFNPLIIYGGVGLGKTHLMHAIGNEAIHKNPDLNVVIITSEKFTLDFVNSLRKNKTIEFAQQYRKADILLIDDIQFFRGKEQTQEQFFHTFNELYQAGKQIVLTADRYPGEMQGLQDRLLSRFQSGLSVDIQPPDFEVRVAILLDKAERNSVDLPYDIIEFIATHMRSNIRDLEGTIIRLLARSSLLNQDIDRNLVKDVVKERVGNKPGRDISMEDVVRKVSEVSGIPEDGIVGQSRKKEIVEARQTAMFLCRSILDSSLSSVGVFFGGRDHTTVMHAIKTIEEKKLKKKNIGENIAQITQELTFI